MSVTNQVGIVVIKYVKQEINGVHVLRIVCTMSWQQYRFNYLHIIILANYGYVTLQHYLPHLANLLHKELENADNW